MTSRWFTPELQVSRVWYDWDVRKDTIEDAQAVANQYMQEDSRVAVVRVTEFQRDQDDECAKPALRYVRGRGESEWALEA